MSAFLLIVAGPHRVEVLALDAPGASTDISLGSDPANRIVTPGAQPFHGCLRRTSDGWKLCHLGSSMADETPLRSGSELVLGQVRLIYTDNLIDAFHTLGWGSKAKPLGRDAVVGPAARSLDAVGRLASGIAHNFNNLLQSILGYTTLAMDGLEEGDRRREDLQEVLKATENAATLTRQLSAFGGIQLLRPVEQSLAAILDDIGEQLGDTLGPSVTLEVNAAADTGLTRADFGQLQQALLTLCSHACEAMPFGGVLRLSTSNETVRAEDPDRGEIPPGEYAVLSVADTGRGIPPENLAHLFEPFFLAADSAEDTGLSLAMVYGTIRQHNGYIHVTSNKQGTTYRIYLPSVGRPQPSQPAGELGGAETILVAEDEQHVRDLAVRVLQSAGYRVLTASNGEEAVAVHAAHRGQLALALLDVVMPKLGGKAAYEQISKADPNLAIVFSSGHAPDMLNRGDVDGQELLLKPYTPELLLRKVRQVLNRSRS